MFSSGRDGFGALKNIKRRNPDIICAGDTAFDDSEIPENDTVLTAAMSGFIMPNEFNMRGETDDEKNLILNMIEQYILS